jgi:hypothetical protein
VDNLTISLTKIRMYRDLDMPLLSNESWKNMKIYGPTSRFYRYNLKLRVDQERVNEALPICTARVAVFCWLSTQVRKEVVVEHAFDAPHSFSDILLNSRLYRVQGTSTSLDLHSDHKIKSRAMISDLRTFQTPGHTSKYLGLSDNHCPRFR